MDKYFVQIGGRNYSKVVCSCDDKQDAFDVLDRQTISREEIGYVTLGKRYIIGTKQPNSKTVVN